MSQGVLAIRWMRLSQARELVRLNRELAERVLRERDYTLDQALRDAKPEHEPEPDPEPQT